MLTSSQRYGAAGSRQTYSTRFSSGTAAGSVSRSGPCRVASAASVSQIPKRQNARSAAGSVWNEWRKTSHAPAYRARSEPAPSANARAGIDVDGARGFRLVDSRSRESSPTGASTAAESPAIHARTIAFDSTYALKSETL